MKHYPRQRDRMLAEIEDDRQERALVLNAATGLQKTAGFGVSLAAGIFEP